MKGHSLLTRQSSSCSRTSLAHWTKHRVHGWGLMESTLRQWFNIFSVNAYAMLLSQCLAKPLQHCQNPSHPNLLQIMHIFLLSPTIINLDQACLESKRVREKESERKRGTYIYIRENKSRWDTYIERERKMEIDENKERMRKRGREMDDGINDDRK